MIRKYLLYKKFYNAWYEIERYIAFKYGLTNNMMLNKELKNILEQMQNLEKTIISDRCK